MTRSRETADIVRRVATPSGEPISIKTAPGATSAQAYGYNILGENQSNTGGYSLEFVSYVHTGAMTDGSNDIPSGQIYRYDDMQSGFATGEFRVLQTPLPVGSGLLHAPTQPQNFSMSLSEKNPQNRFADTGFKGELRLYSNAIFAEIRVPETLDFTAELGNLRIGFNVPSMFYVAKSERTANYQGVFEHAKTHSPYGFDPNSIATDGFGMWGTGFRPYPNAITIVNGGSGYTAGDRLTANTGYDGTFNENSVIQVLTVNGSGVIQTAELYRAGSYETAPPSPCPVTGGTGTGATFSFDMRAQVGTQPQAYLGIAGGWKWAVDAAPLPGRYAKLTEGFARMPNGKGIKARNAAGSADIDVINTNAADFVTLAGKEVVPTVGWSPTLGTVGGSSTFAINSARWRKINGVVSVDISFQITAIGTGTGGITADFPTATGGFAKVGYGKCPTSDAGLTGFAAAGDAVIVFKKSDGTNPLVDGAFYTIHYEYDATS